MNIFTAGFILYCLWTRSPWCKCVIFWSIHYMLIFTFESIHDFRIIREDWSVILLVLSLLFSLILIKKDEFGEDSQRARQSVYLAREECVCLLMFQLARKQIPLKKIKNKKNKEATLQALRPIWRLWNKQMLSFKYYLCLCIHAKKSYICAKRAAL